MPDLELIHRPAAQGQENRPPLLFVHGAWHGAWCWDEHFLPYFAGKGWDCYALSLRGHGKSEGGDKLRWTSIAAYVDDVHQVVATLPEPPVIIAHSMGGFITQKYLENHALPGVVLLASIPPSGSGKFVFKTLWRMPIPFFKAVFKLSLIEVVKTPELARQAFFSPDTPQADIDIYSALVQNESFRILPDTFLLALPRRKKIRDKNIPMLVIGAADDRVFTINEVIATARAYDAQIDILPNLAHDIMLEPRWEMAAQRIEDWLEERFNDG